MAPGVSEATERVMAAVNWSGEELNVCMVSQNRGYSKVAHGEQRKTELTFVESHLNYHGFD